VNVTLFIIKCLTESVEKIGDSSAGMFLENQDQRVKAMLFAQQVCGWVGSLTQRVCADKVFQVQCGETLQRTATYCSETVVSI